ALSPLPLARVLELRSLSWVIAGLPSVPSNNPRIVNLLVPTCPIAACKSSVALRHRGPTSSRTHVSAGPTGSLISANSLSLASNTKPPTITTELANQMVSRHAHRPDRIEKPGPSAQPQEIPMRLTGILPECRSS